MLDIVLISLIVLLSLKGFFSGLIRELVGFIGLIGGIFVASRASDPVAKALGDALHMDVTAILKLAGFLLTLAVVWGGSSFIATVFTALRAEPHSTVTRLLGMGIGGLKYFLIFSMIVASLFNNKLIHDNFAKSINASRLFPIFNRMGSKLTNIAPLPSAMTPSKNSPKK